MQVLKFILTHASLRGFQRVIHLLVPDPHPHHPSALLAGELPGMLERRHVNPVTTAAVLVLNSGGGWVVPEIEDRLTLLLGEVD